MNIVKTEIEGVLIIEPRLFRDARGYFFESFSEREFEEKIVPILGHSVHFCQDNESMSSYGVMRGLHFQRPPYTQRLMEVFLSLIIALVLIGRYLQNMPISQRKIRSMQC